MVTEHEHTWIFTRMENFRWKFEKGNPSGYCFPIGLAIELANSNHNHTMTGVGLLKTWDKNGFNFVYVSFKHFECNICKARAKAEFYTNPVFIDPNHFNLATKQEEVTK